MFRFDADKHATDANNKEIKHKQVGEDCQLYFQAPAQAFLCFNMIN
jgi:hypothetical protein